MSILRFPVYAACPCSCCMLMPLLDVHVPAACPRPCCMDLNQQHGHRQAAWTLILRVWTWTCSMDMGTHPDNCVHAACLYSCPCCMSMSILHIHVHAACSCTCWMFMSILHIHVNAAVHVAARSCPCCMSMSMLHGHGHTP